MDISAALCSGDAAIRNVPSRQTVRQRPAVNDIGAKQKRCSKRDQQPASCLHVVLVSGDEIDCESKTEYENIWKDKKVSASGSPLSIIENSINVV